MKVVVNAVSAKLGGAATYVQNLARSLEEQAAPGDEFLFVVPPERAADLCPAPPRVRVVASAAASASYARRWWWDQVALRRILAREQPDVLFSSANFAMLRCPCPQVLLVRIPIYFSQEYLQHILPQKGLAFRSEIALRRWLVCRSVAAADCLMTPTEAMLADLRRFARASAARAVVNPYGVPRSRVLPTQDAGHRGSGKLRLLWVSHYADHKNLGTLLRAVAELRHAGEDSFELLLTLDPRASNGQHTPMPPSERELLRNLEGVVRAVGVHSYDATWAFYGKADLFVFPSLAESFGHPLVEAMASGVPVLASDIAVHREICGDAAAYFPVMDAAALAAELRKLMADGERRDELAARGRQRVQQFLWEDHVARLLGILRETAASKSRSRAA
jgi:glycosyltransferase involved in cell wall biosynthesis